MAKRGAITLLNKLKTVVTKRVTRRALFNLFAVAVSVTLVSLSLWHFVTYLTAPQLGVSLEAGFYTVDFDLGLSDRSHERFEGFAYAMDVTIRLLSLDYGMVDVSIPIVDAARLKGRNFTIESYSIDLHYTSVSLWESGRYLSPSSGLDINASNPHQASFQIAQDIQTNGFLRISGGLRPLNISSNVVFYASIMVNEVEFNMTETLAMPPELQLSHMPMYFPPATVQISELGVTGRRVGSRTTSIYIMRISDAYIEMHHFQQNIRLVLGALFLSSGISSVSVFLDVRRLLGEKKELA